jgi:hypothetical protein
MASSWLRFLDHTHRPCTGGKTPLDKWSVRRRDLYLTTQNNDKRQTSSMPSMGFEPTVPTCERLQIHTKTAQPLESALNGCSREKWSYWVVSYVHLECPLTAIEITQWKWFSCYVFSHFETCVSYNINKRPPKVSFTTCKFGGCKRANEG